MNKLIEELAALEEKATPGPWEVEQGEEIDHRGQRYFTQNFYSGTNLFMCTGDIAPKNLSLIVAMRNALPEVLGIIAAQKSFIAHVEGERNAALARVKELEEELFNLCEYFSGECGELKERAEKAEAALSRAEAALVKLAIKVEEMGGGNGEDLMRVAIEYAAQEAAKRGEEA